MSDSQKGASSSSKEKTSLLDLDIGKDFLSSWKSMSVTEDDAMDFDFGTVAKGKKKGFNFDKADMDFNLDAEFGKISSFKVDMSYLDILSPTKKAGKPKERSKEVSVSGKEKTDRFTFPFDFNELDSLSFESSLMKDDEKSNKNQDREASSNKSGCQGSGIHLVEDICALEEGIALKSGGETTSKIDTQVGGVGDLDSTSVDDPSESVANDNYPLKSLTFGDKVVIHGARISPEKIICTSTQEMDQESCPPEKTTYLESYAQETVEDLSIPSVSENASTQNIASELREEVSTTAAEVSTITGGEQNVNVKLMVGSGSNNENSLLENMPPHMMSSLSNNGERRKFGGDNHVLIGNKDGAEPAQGDSIFEHTSNPSVSRELHHDAKADGENQDSSSKLLMVPLDSGTTVDRLPEKERETGVQSKNFKRSDEIESQLQQTSLSGTKLTSFGRKRIGISQISPVDERREQSAKDAQNGSRLTGISGSNPRELTRSETVQSGIQESVKDLTTTREQSAKDAQSGSRLNSISRSHPKELTRSETVQSGIRESIKDLNTTREGFNADGAENGSKLISISRPRNQDVEKKETVLRGSEKKIKDLNTFSSHAHPSSLREQANKSVSQNCVNLPVSSMTIRSIKNICVEKNKIPSLKADKSTSVLSSLKISRTLGANHDPLNSTFPKDITSLRNSEQSIELQGKTGSKMAHCAETTKQTSLTPNLKRKTFEELDANMLTLKPSKRLSVSPSESRSFREPSERVVDNKVCDHQDLADGNTRNTNECKIYTHNIPQEINMTGLETTLVMENDGNFEKAEACTKELEDICSMLKKKHEEAKEILVRAIVNNNNLLMLNHPIYEEKIRMVQKFAASLMSK